MQVIKMIKLTKIIFPMPSLMSATFRVVFGTSSNVFSLTSIIDLQSRHITLQRNATNHRSGVLTRAYRNKNTCLFWTPTCLLHAPPFCRFSSRSMLCQPWRYSASMSTSAPANAHGKNDGMGKWSNTKCRAEEKILMASSTSELIAPTPTLRV